MLSFPTLHESKSYSDVAKSVSCAKEILASLGIRVSESSVLHKIFQDTLKVTEFWETDRDKLSLSMALNLLYSDIICSAIIKHGSDPGVSALLRRVARNNVDRGSRGLSQGKDALWELVLSDYMSKASIKARLVDPPDIVADMSFGEYSIACKKVYSENNVENQVRVGARQILKSGNKGIVALNLDDLTPEGSILADRSLTDVMGVLSRFNLSFIDRHRDVFQKYVKRGRIDGVLVAVSVPSDILTDARRLNNLTQHDFWTLNSESSGSKRIKEFVNKLAARNTAALIRLS